MVAYLLQIPLKYFYFALDYFNETGSNCNSLNLLVVGSVAVVPLKIQCVTDVKLRI